MRLLLLHVCIEGEGGGRGGWMIGPGLVTGYWWCSRADGTLSLMCTNIYIRHDKKTRINFIKTCENVKQILHRFHRRKSPSAHGTHTPTTQSLSPTHISHLAHTLTITISLPYSIHFISVHLSWFHSCTPYIVHTLCIYAFHLIADVIVLAFVFRLVKPAQIHTTNAENYGTHTQPILLIVSKSTVKIN